MEPSTGGGLDHHDREIGGRTFRTIGTGVRTLSLAPLYSIELSVEAGHLGALVERIPVADDDPLDQRFFSALVDSPVSKAAVVVFHHDLPLEQARAVVTEGLRQGLGRRDEGRIAQLLTLLDRDLQRGDRIEWRSIGNRLLTIEFDGIFEFEDRLLARATWLPYLGPNPVSASLKGCIARSLFPERCLVLG
ncbi:MAG: hypothetical protein QM765_22315 [Myxococcales bacterium]